MMGMSGAVNVRRSKKSGRRFEIAGQNVIRGSKLRFPDQEENTSDALTDMTSGLKNQGKRDEE